MFFTKLPRAIVQSHSFPIVRYFNGILFVVVTLVFLKCAHYSTDFGTWPDGVLVSAGGTFFLLALPPHSAVAGFASTI